MGFGEEATMGRHVLWTFGSKAWEPRRVKPVGFTVSGADPTGIMSADRPNKQPHRDEMAGVPPLTVCEARAAEALKAAEETKLGNVRDLYSRSALRWSELADQKITRRG